MLLDGCNEDHPWVMFRFLILPDLSKQVDKLTKLEHNKHRVIAELRNFGCLRESCEGDGRSMKMKEQVIDQGQTTRW